MERVTYKVSLDMKKNTHSRVMLGAIKGENLSRRIEVTLMEAGKPFICEDTVQATIYVLKPNQTVPSVNGATIKGNVITYDLLGSDVDTVGTVTFQLKLTEDVEGETSTLITTTFEADVDGAIVDDSGVPSQPTFTALELALAKVSVVQKAFEDEIPKVEIALETIQDLVDRETETLDKAEGYATSAHNSAIRATQYSYEAKQAAEEANRDTSIVERAVEETKGYKDEAYIYSQDAEAAVGHADDFAADAEKYSNDAKASASESKTARDEAKTYRDEVASLVNSGAATPTQLGLIKPDNTTTFVDGNGVLSAVGGGGGGASVWGAITGSISNQKDLQDALNDKVGDIVFGATVSGLRTDISQKADIQHSHSNLYYSKDQVYTKTEVDTALNSKADTNNVYSKSDVYTKTEVDGLIPKGDGIIYLTMAEYLALGDSVLTDNKTYGITDVDNYPQAESEEF